MPAASRPPTATSPSAIQQALHPTDKIDPEDDVVYEELHEQLGQRHREGLLVERRSRHRARRRGAVSERTQPERRLGWMLCAPAVIAMLLVTGYPIAYAIYSRFKSRPRFPDEGGFVGLDNYVTVLSSSTWWQDVFNTVITIVLGVDRAHARHADRARHAPRDLRPRRRCAPRC